jgi:hypothetical protein
MMALTPAAGSVGLRGLLARRIGVVEHQRAVAVPFVVDEPLAAADIVGETTAGGRGRRVAHDRRAAERLERRPRWLGPWLRIDLAVPLRHFAVEAAV